MGHEPVGHVARLLLARVGQARVGVVSPSRRGLAVADEHHFHTSAVSVMPGP